MPFIRFMFRLVLWIAAIFLIIEGVLFTHSDSFIIAAVLILIQIYYELVDIKESL